MSWVRKVNNKTLVYFLNVSKHKFKIAVGEPATCMAVVVVFALRNALYAARKDSGLPDVFFPMGKV